MRLRRLSLYLPVLLTLAFSSSLISAEKRAKKKRPPIDPNRQVDIKYGNDIWNQDPTRLDEATVIIRDARSGKIVLINLFETAPDEAVFKGRFSVGWGTAKSLVPEVYIPLQEKINTKQGKEKILSEIKNRKMKRKPFILTRGENGQQVIEVFDTKQQAKLALSNYRQMLMVKRKASIPETVVSKGNLALAEKMAEAKRQAEIKEKALNAEAERIRMQQLEEKKRLEREAKERALAKAEKERRKKLAVKISQEAMDLYRKGKYPEAQEKFEQAVELDPTNKSYYFAYGITLYSNKKFNRSIVIFNSIPTGSVDEKQKAYYLGMAYFRIEDYKNAIEKLEIAIAAKTEPISSGASFYKGLALMAKKSWEPAKASFQWVLDNSKDPKLDEKAEEMIEKIARIQNFEKNKAKKHILTAGAGLQYDSNVLLQSESASTATASDKADVRFSGTAGYEYRIRYDKEREWSLKSDLLYMYSAKSENAKADPMVISLSSPYVFKGKTKSGKGFKSLIKTKLDMIYMDPVEGATRTDILDTYGVEWDYTVIESETKFTKYSTKLLNNNSHTSSGDDDSDGLSLLLGYGNTWFLDKKKGIILVNDNDFTYYNGKGINQKYYKLNTAVTYLRPLNWKDFSQIMKASLYYSSYPDSSASRTDTNIGLNYLLSKKLGETWSFVGGLTYTNNNSTDSTKKYSKFLLMSMFTGTWKF